MAGKKIATPRRTARKQFADVRFPESYSALTNIMQTETASIISDYIRQYVGVPEQKPAPGSGVFINFDRVLNNQTYQELAWYDLYAYVEQDPHISAILQTRKLAVAGTPWTIVAADEEDPNAVMHAEFVTDKLQALENFNQDVYELLGAVGMGFAVSEVIWRTDKDRTIGVKEILNRPQRRFQFDAVNRTLKLRNIANPWWGDPLPDRKFIYHRNGAMWENPFGDALDQKLYWMWLFKKTVLTFWMKKNEVEMSAVPLVQHPKNANEKLKNEAMEVAQMIRNGGYGRLPDNFAIIWAEAKTAAANAEQYSRFEEFVNDEMTKCVLGQVLTTEASGSRGHGSKSLGMVHNDIRGDIMSFDMRAIEGTLNSSLIKWLIEINFGPQDAYPRFKFMPDDPIDKNTDSNMVLNLTNAGYRIKADWIEEHFDVELEEVVEATGKTAPGQPPVAAPVTDKSVDEIELGD